MDKRPIEQQVAELTPEQRNNMGKVFKTYVISLVSILLLFGIAVVALLTFSNAREKEAKEKYDEVQAIVDSFEQKGKYNPNAYEALELAMDNYYDIREGKALNLMVISIIALFLYLLAIIIIKKKYPYFSDKKYTYLKKLQKASRQ